uniref:NADH-ubiquinone oxidoreductase chain 2 n=1 Tax=Nothopuga sp. 1 LP-2008 TaxID=504482 RepID=A9LI74_9ARAC|nr:NADH dehydrogenase subunit 2 [Nothopuga sp. 1 LP-2008]ABS71902.1 NADH dehydrogenase subunit 2 [Nothopuga sp. 1 LP-2008]
MFYSVNLLFLTLLTFSTIITVSSPSWFCMWMGIEMNTMAFIPLMYNLYNKLPTESALKYFLTQTFASMIMFLAIILMMTKDFYYLNSSSNMLLLSTGIKSGAAPFHMWYPSVVEGLSWSQIIMLMTWQKIAPLTMMSMTQPSIVNMIMVVSSLTIGPISAFNQTSIRKIMAYSSITHMSWMIIMMYNSSSLWITYMLIYFLTTIIMIIFLQLLKIYHTMQINMINNKQYYMLLTNFLSMGGFPPLLGFIAKWLILNELINNSMVLVSILLVVSSCMNLYIYLRIIHPSMHMKMMNTKLTIMMPSTTMFFLTTISILSFLIILL